MEPGRRTLAETRPQDDNLAKVGGFGAAWVALHGTLDDGPSTSQPTFAREHARNAIPCEGFTAPSACHHLRLKRHPRPCSCADLRKAVVESPRHPCRPRHSRHPAFRDGTRSADIGGDEAAERQPCRGPWVCVAWYETFARGRADNTVRPAGSGGLAGTSGGSLTKVQLSPTESSIKSNAAQPLSWRSCDTLILAVESSASTRCVSDLRGGDPVGRTMVGFVVPSTRSRWGWCCLLGTADG